jgi:proteasome lid subunit RPN8/RPN11
MESNMKNLDLLLGQEEPEMRKAVVSNGLDSLYITKYAFEKAYAYARLACEKARRSIECGGYLIAPKDSKDRIATDSFLANNQDVSDGLFTIEAEDVIKAGREITESGFKVLGWWHSHGNLDTFFSRTDDNGQRTVLNEIGAFNYIIQKDEKEVSNLEIKSEDGRIIMFDKRSPERKYEIEIDGNASKISIAKLKLQQEKKIGFAYGLVVNNRRRKKEPYAEIATRDFCGYCKSSSDKSDIVSVTLFDSGKFSLDEDILMEDIKERVKMRPRLFGFFGGGYPIFGSPTFGASSYPVSGNKKEESIKYSIGDEVRIVRGYSKGKSGKISKQLLQSGQVEVDVKNGIKIYPFIDELEPINLNAIDEPVKGLFHDIKTESPSKNNLDNLFDKKENEDDKDSGEKNGV